MRVLDLCSGTGSATKAFEDMGDEVVRVDIDKRFRPDIIADVRWLHFVPKSFDFVWASPPCDEFARYGNPFHPYNRTICDASIWNACMRIAKEIGAPVVIENVRGAQYWMGKAICHRGAFYFWGDVPLLASVDGFKDTRHIKKPSERAKIPYAMSKAFAKAIR